MADHLVLGAFRSCRAVEWMRRLDLRIVTGLPTGVLDRSLVRLREQGLIEYAAKGNKTGHYRYVVPRPPCGMCKRFPCMKWTTCRKPLIPDEVGGIE